MNLKVTQETVSNDYKRMKRLASYYLRIGKYETVLDLLKYSSYLMYSYNQIFSDDEVEDILLELGRILIPAKEKVWASRKGHVVFCDSFSLAKKGLAYVYLWALIQLGYDIHYVVTLPPNPNNEDVIRLLSAADNHTIDYVTDKKNLDQIMHFNNLFHKYSPEIIFFYGTPWDVSLLVAASQKPETCKSVLINLTDHAYWSGAKCVDQIIEFRPAGYALSEVYRGLSHDKHSILPYFPMNILIDTPFAGLPFPANQRFFMSGGSAYKISGSDVFGKMVTSILDANPDLVFLFLSDGTAPAIDELSAGSYKGRVFHIQKRDDIFEIIKSCEFYINTYPLGGGIMVQLAVLAGKVCLSLEGNSLSDPASVLQLDEQTVKEFIFSDIDELVHEANRLLADEKYYTKQSYKLKDTVITPDEFEQKLSDILLNSNQQIDDFSDIHLDIDDWSKMYFSQNNSFFTYCKNFHIGKDFSMIRFFPVEVIFGCILSLLDKLTKKRAFH